MCDHRWARALTLAWWLAVAVLACGCHRAPTEPLAAEFAGAYPSSIAPVGVVRTYDLVAAPTEIPIIDGRKLAVWAYNGQVPGPTLHVRLGETLRVRFRNDLPQPTTIHWHGVRVPNAMDGVPGVTQPPIPPGGTFVYEFTPKDPGTFWFHPHVRSSEQVERGLYGVLIVEDREPAPYAADVVWVLDDWLLDEKGQIFPQFNTRHDLMHDGRWGNFVTVNGRTDASLRLRSGERIRLRLVNSANGRVFAPDFGAMDARIIAVDGMYARAPIPLSRFELAPGNRLDLDLGIDASGVTKVSVIDRFYPRMENQLAQIEIDGSAEPSVFPSPAHGHVPEWKDALAFPLSKEFRLGARPGGTYGIEWTIDDRAFGGHDHAEPPAATLTEGHFHRLRFTNTSFRLHPIHLHGMFFRLLARNGQPVAEPFFRDTVLIHSQETIDIGVVPMDTGVWMMHCHILEHAEAGMMTTLRVNGS